MTLKKSALIVILILLDDQISKIYVKTTFTYQQSVEVFSWFKIPFIENEGAAWGAKLSDIFPIADSTGKLILTGTLLPLNAAICTVKLPEGVGLGCVTIFLESTKLELLLVPAYLEFKLVLFPTLASLLKPLD